MKAEGTYLQKILDRTRADLPGRMKQKAPAILRTLAKAAPKTPGFEQALRSAKGTAIIAEIKRRSPSLGFIDRDLDVAQTAADYASGGAACLSVLTENPNFAGTLDDLRLAHAACKLPALRKDFIVDPYQLAEARAFGAAAALLIVAALDAKQLGALMKEARELGLEVLVEVHDETELGTALDAGALMVGINNRDLRSFAVDLGTSERLAPMAARAGVLVVAESGIKTAEDVRRLRGAGVEAFLIGETFIRAADRAAAVRELVGA